MDDQEDYSLASALSPVLDRFALAKFIAEPMISDQLNIFKDHGDGPKLVILYESHLESLVDWPEWLWTITRKYAETFAPHFMAAQVQLPASPEEDGYQLAIQKMEAESSDEIRYQQRWEACYGWIEESNRTDPNSVMPRTLSGYLEWIDDRISNGVRGSSERSIPFIKGLQRGFEVDLGSLDRIYRGEKYRNVWEFMIRLSPIIENLRRSGRGSIRKLHDMICSYIPSYSDVSDDTTQKLCRSIGLSFRSKGRPKKIGMRVLPSTPI